MATEHDLSATLPPSPPPRPDRREATIAAAMQLFDGEAPAVAPSPPARRRLIARPEFGALAAAALVAAVGLPLWLSADYAPRVADEQPAVAASAKPNVSTPLPAAAVVPPTVTRTSPTAKVAARSAPSAPPVVAPSVALSAESLREVEAAPVMPPAAGQMFAPPPIVMSPAAPPAPVISRAAPVRSAPPPPPPPPPAMLGARNAVGLNNIVVTGSQRREGRAARRGDWNACTVDDPQQDMNACRAILPVTAPGAAGRAAALVADGLGRAWQGDLGEAIAAFDRALAVSPQLASAWLNRGLAHARAGDDARARADLDRAVRYAPGDPRARFQRGLVLRRLGRIAEADADEARAAELDPRYVDMRP